MNADAINKRMLQLPQDVKQNLETILASIEKSNKHEEILRLYEKYGSILSKYNPDVYSHTEICIFYERLEQTRQQIKIN